MNERGIIPLVMAMAGAISPCFAEPQRIYPPKVYPEHVRHQGTKERAKRLKRMEQRRGKL